MNFFKKIWVYFFTFLISLVAVCNFSLALYARQYIKYEITVNKDVKVARVVINGTEIPRERYVNDLVYINQNDELTSNENGKITILTSKADDIFINFNTEDYSNINVLKDGINQPMHDNLFMNTNNMFNLIKLSLSKYSLLIFVIVYPIILLCVIELKKLFNKLKANEIKIIDIILGLLSLFLVYFTCFYIMLATFRELILIPMVIIASLGVYFLRNAFKNNIENAYLYFAIIFGITILFLLPPFGVPDENKHFVKSFEMSYGKVQDDGYVYLPKSLEDFSYKYTHSVLEYDTKYNGKNYFSDVFQTSDYGNLSESITSYSNTRNLGILPYLPSAILIAIGRILGFSPLILVLLGKFINLLIVILLCYNAIKLIPYYKKIMFVVTLFPIFIQQSAAINQDFLTNAIIVFIVALIFYFKEKIEKVDIKDMIILSISALVLALCKFGYFPILALVFLIPNEKFKNKKVGILFKSLLFIIPSMLSYLNNINVGAAKGKSIYYTYTYALKNPIKAIQIYLDTAVWRFDLDIFRGFFDGFAWSTIWNEPLVLSILSIMYVLLIAVKDDKDKKMDIKQKLLLLGIAFVVIFCVYSAMFFNWTKWGAEKIDGLQPRYFIAPALLIYMALSNDIFKLNIKNKNLLYSTVIVIVYTLILVTITIGFY